MTRFALARSLAVLAAGAGVVTGTASGAGSPTAVVGCSGKPVAEPAAIVFACGDGNFGAKGLRWIGFGAPTAAAVGTGYANDCKPYCAAGHFHDYRIVVVASAPKTCHGKLAYTTLTAAFIGPSPFPKLSAADSVYRFPCR
jgi:hypothetical protein